MKNDKTATRHKINFVYFLVFYSDHDIAGEETKLVFCLNGLRVFNF